MMLTKKQNFLCRKCGESLAEKDGLDLHHILPKSRKVRDNYDNLMLIHRSCHGEVHSMEKSKLLPLVGQRTQRVGGAIPQRGKG
jgi:RNA-directed DNA polymerase